MKPSIVGIEDDEPVFDPDAATLARWAAVVHQADCLECQHSDTRCPAGEKYHASTQTDRSWITGYATGD